MYIDSAPRWAMPARRPPPVVDARGFAARCRTKAIIPSRFHQHPPRMAIARASNSSRRDCRPGVFAGDQAQIGHQLLRGAETLEVSDFRRQHHGCYQVDSRIACSARTKGARVQRSTIRRYRRLAVERVQRLLEGMDVIADHPSRGFLGELLNFDPLQCLSVYLPPSDQRRP